MSPTLISFKMTLVLLMSGFCCLAQQEEPNTVATGYVKDDFVDVVDMDETLPKWANGQFDKFRDEYHQLFQVKPTYLEADFRGDGTKCIAIFVNRISDGKRGIIFLFKTDKPIIIGAGNKFGPGGDNFEWADEWSLFEKRITYEITFKDNGDVLGDKEVRLEHPAISIRESEGSSGLIYFNGQEFVWIHQGD